MSHTLDIEDLRDLTPTIRLFTLVAPAGDLPDYTPGAHIEVALGDLGTRAYSLLRFPGADENKLQIAVQREADGTGGSQKMHGFEIGQRLTVGAAKNQFPLVDTDAPSVLIAGGIGITPIIAMATALQKAGKPFALHFATRSRALMAFESEIKTAFGDAVQLHFDDETPIDLNAVLGGCAKGSEIYVCGPKPMIEAVKATATDAGHAQDKIHFELFTNDAQADGDQAFEVEINDGRVFTIPPGQTIVEVLEEAGVDVMYDCQRGDCGICQCDVISGEPDHRDVVLSDEERAAGEIIQICVSRAKSARLVLDI